MMYRVGVGWDMKQGGAGVEDGHHDAAAAVVAELVLEVKLAWAGMSGGPELGCSRRGRAG